ncbi:lytic transglycosylase domain-containing protein [Granulicella sp. 5B5]|uniref:lytic transglycosylase domain-containing protein n=1 Tax=Granulicella sp. 5B5 TaxID=1617967 RepID=UPI00210810E2|nr:lytic transglycosylase domain-containing protein [Granulicella sp. 5B5]
MPRPRPSRTTVIAVLCAIGLASSAHALERVNLTTGFSYDCVRSEPLDASHVRLYLYTPGSTASANDFVVIAAREIASIEKLPDPPAPKPIVAPTHPPADVHDLLARAGQQHNIDVELLASVVKAESGGHAHAVSRAGAQGLMQLMPSTARDLGVKDPFQPDQNIAGGAAYLDSLLTLYNNNLDLALAAYNAGPAAVAHYHNRVPPYAETRAYVVRVENEFIRRKKAAQRAAQHAATLTATVVP